MGIETFKKYVYILGPNVLFEKNKECLYILRDTNYIQAKYILKYIYNLNINISRGNLEKSHVLSPLDLRLSNYLLAMFNLDYKLVSNLNVFNTLSKFRYLSNIPKVKYLLNYVSQMKNI